MLVTIFITVADYWDLKQREILFGMPEAQAYRKLASIMEHDVLPVIGMKRFPEITLGDLNRIFEMERQEGYSNSRMASCKTILKRLFFCAAEDRLVADNLADKLRTFPAIHKELITYSREQELALLKAYQKTPLAELYTILHITGLHFTELAACFICDYDDAARTLRLNFVMKRDGRAEKAEQDKRTIPVSEVTAVLLRRAIAKRMSRVPYPDETGEDYIFLRVQGAPLTVAPYQYTDIIRKESGIHTFTVSDVVHHFGIVALREGVNPKSLMLYLGQKTGFNISRYECARREYVHAADQCDDFYRELSQS